MSVPYRHSSRSPQLYIPLTGKEKALLWRISNRALVHTSGGSYDMCAAWSKGSQLITGYNRLDRAANTLHDAYPEVSGTHAELDLWRRAAGSMHGGTVYVVGKVNTSRNLMQCTRPCRYCAPLLYEAGVRFVVYLWHGVPRKCSTSALVWGDEAEEAAEGQSA